MRLDFDTYETICDLLADETLDVETIATMVGVSVEDVQYVCRAETDIF